MKSSVTILIVDDEDMMRCLLEKILSRESYNIIKAENGKKALEKLKNEKVDIIVSDIKMPEMNGFELLKHVKDEYPNIGVIIMTAYGDTYTLKDALLLGADEYITKPFKSYEVSLVIERTYWRLLSGKDKSSEKIGP